MSTERMARMIQVEHFIVGRQWCFVGTGAPSVNGGGRTLNASIESAEHAVRHYLERQLHRQVDQCEAAHLTNHVCMSHEGHAAPKTWGAATSARWPAASQPEVGGARPSRSRTRNDENRCSAVL